MRKRWPWLLTSGWVLFGMETLAWAAKKTRIPQEDKGYMQWAVALVAVALICLPAFINPKRSHLT